MEYDFLQQYLFIIVWHLTFTKLFCIYLLI